MSGEDGADGPVRLGFFAILKDTATHLWRAAPALALAVIVIAALSAATLIGDERSDYWPVIIGAQSLIILVLSAVAGGFIPCRTGLDRRAPWRIGGFLVGFVPIGLLVLILNFAVGLALAPWLNIDLKILFQEAVMMAIIGALFAPLLPAAAAGASGRPRPLRWSWRHVRPVWLVVASVAAPVLALGGAASGGFELAYIYETAPIIMSSDVSLRVIKSIDVFFVSVIFFVQFAVFGALSRALFAALSQRDVIAGRRAVTDAFD